jgi:tetratricopeptide (TPR) repeat protein
MSGGPILNANSQLVGIHGRAITQFSQTRGVNPMFNQKEGLNLGIPLNSFLEALPKVGLKLGFQLPSGKSKSAEPIADDFFIEGMEKSAQGDYQGASDAFDRAMSLQPTYAVASYYRMQLRPFTLKSQGWKVVAEQVMADQKHFQGIAKLSKVSPYATLPPFLKFLSRGFDEKVKNPAANELERSVQEEPDDTALIYIRGLQRFGSGDYTGAVADFDGFLQLTTPESQLRRYVSEYKSYAMLELKDYRGVKIFLDQAMKEHPSLFKGDNTLLCYRAEARYALGDRKGAQADLETAQMSCRNAIVKPTDNTVYVKFIERGAAKEESYEEKEAKLIEEYRTKVVPQLEKCINKRKEIICKPKI